MKKCINCTKANEYLKKKKRDIEHTAHDKINCSTYKAKLETIIANTNYPYRPIDDVLFNNPNECV